MNGKLIILKKILDMVTLASAAVGTGGLVSGIVSTETGIAVIGIALIIKAVGSLIGDKWDDGVFNNSFK